MTVENALRLMAGIMIVVSVILVQFVSPWFLLLTLFIGLNLFQSSITNTCPAVAILRKIGLKRCVAEQKE